MRRDKRLWRPLQWHSAVASHRADPSLLARRFFMEHFFATTMSAINTNGHPCSFQYNSGTLPESPLLLARRGLGPSESHSDNGALRTQQAYASGADLQAGSQRASFDYEQQTRFHQNLSRIMVEAAGSPLAVSGPGRRRSREARSGRGTHLLACRCRPLDIIRRRGKGSSAPTRPVTCARTRHHCNLTKARTLPSWSPSPRKNLGETPMMPIGPRVRRLPSTC